MTDWRTIGDVSPETWTAQLASVGSPLTTVAMSCYRAAQPHTALCLAILDQESSYAKRFRFNVESNYNPLNLRPPGGDGYLRFTGWTEGIRAWRERLTDPTYRDGIYARTRTIAELIHVYAPDSDGNSERGYVAGIEASLLRWGVTPQEVQPSMSELVFGTTPYPVVVQSHLPADNPLIKTSGAPDIPDAVVWHRMLGTWNGTNIWFHGGHAATCYGVAVAATDGQFNAGNIYEWIEPGNGWYGESSGPVNQPYGDGLALVNKIGVGNVNRVTKAIEISGEYDTPLDEKSRAAIVNMTAYWANQKKIPWDVFPMVPGENRSFVVWHQEITIGSGKVCPGAVVMNETPALIERIRQVLKRDQVGAKPVKPPKYTPSVLPEWWQESLLAIHPTDQRVGSIPYRVMRRSFVVMTETSRRSQPEAMSGRSGPNAKEGEKVFSERLVSAGPKNWILTNDGHYILESKVSPRVTLKPATQST